MGSPTDRDGPHPERGPERTAEPPMIGRGTVASAVDSVDIEEDTQAAGNHRPSRPARLRMRML